MSTYSRFSCEKRGAKRWQVNSFIHFKAGTSFVLDSGYNNVVKTEYVFFFRWKVRKEEGVETCAVLGFYVP